MPERLVDVVNGDNTVLHTFPITIEHAGRPVPDVEYEAKAVQAAAHAQLVPAADRAELSTRMHVGRGGAMAPYGDDQDVGSETRPRLEQMVRERAYYLWLKDGGPDGRADEYWHRAHEQHLRERAYTLWQQEGCPEGRADDCWYRTVAFEAC